LASFMNNYAWKIFASGDINEDAGKRRVWLHSSPKRIFPLVRASQLNYVGGKVGYCYSACATAFLRV
jgi:hypothetical protein